MQTLHTHFRVQVVRSFILFFSSFLLGLRFVCRFFFCFVLSSSCSSPSRFVFSTLRFFFDCFSLSCCVCLFRIQIYVKALYKEADYCVWLTQVSCGCQLNNNTADRMRYHKPLVSPDARIFVALIFSLGKTDFKSRPFRARTRHSKCLQSMKQSRDFHSPNATGLHESLSHRRCKITWNPIFGLLKIFVCFFNRQHNFFSLVARFAGRSEPETTQRNN